MKKIEAFVRSENLEDMKEIMDRFCLNGLSITQVMGCGKQKGWTEYVRGTEVDYNFLTKLKVEVVVPDEMVETVLDGIIEKTHTGNFGDGKIFIYDVEDAIRIRTKERGIDAIK